VSRLRIAVLVALASLVAPAAQAQQASIIGVAVDDTKAVVPGVAVTATDQAAGRQIVAITNERGEYRLLNMPAGKYTIQAELSGFSTVVLRDVELLVGQNATIPLTMELAGARLTVLAVPWHGLTIAGRRTPTAGRWAAAAAGPPLMELSAGRGVTASDVSNSMAPARWTTSAAEPRRPQITQKVAAPFGCRADRESIAEFGS
jgi:hypothetical protein